MKIIQLTASNVKRLKAVEITPDGTHVLLRPIAEALCLDADFLAGAR